MECIHEKMKTTNQLNTQQLAKTSFTKKSWLKLKYLLSKYKRGRGIVRRVMPKIDLVNKKVTQVNKGDVKLGRLLGAGGFGSVYLGAYKEHDVAVKIMNKQCKNVAAQEESFKAELHVLDFEHPNIVKTLTAIPLDTFEEGAWIVMEYAGSKTLQTMINHEELSVKTRIKFAFQMSDALRYIHDNHVLHLDLKPANILITARGDIKIADFGCSQKVEVDTGLVSPTQRSLLTGTFAYRAPELLKGQVPSCKADIYAMGVTLWQMLARENPYGNENQHVVIFSVVAYGHRPSHPDIEMDPFEECYRDLYSQCWSVSQLDRPSAMELYETLKIWKKYM
ncbi:serine/threonine-protein kinase mos-like [Saccostrea echinata]|uniref:serine/threonine-protein kinase mos-like n=1 Tax=Saccostrea echinata TaxID=191078 RepID=UPI002A80258F|nr:serine/threonine-protein kinase mos-like [Saccostrea echinata]